MIFESTKRIFSGIIIATYLVFYTAPMGLCVTAVPKINAAVQKPALRGSASTCALKLEGDIAISKSNPKISLSLRDSDVKQVLRMFADKAGKNIIFHSSVDLPDTKADGSVDNTSITSVASDKDSTKKGGRTVTMDLVNVPLNDAFRMVMQVTGLTFYIDNNTLVVTSASAARTMNLSKQELMVIPVKYVEASVLANFLNKDIFSINKPGLSNSQIAVTNPNTNEILIFGTKNDYLMAKKIVTQFDKKTLEGTYILNHTTPKEMADVLCNFIKTNNNFNVSDTKAGGGGSSAQSSAPAPSSGSKSSSSSSSSGSSKSGSIGGSSSSALSNVTLGTGYLACQYYGSVNTENLSSLNTNSISVTYYPDRGTLQVLGGSAQQHEYIKEFISKNDIKLPQAYLEVSIIEMNETGTKQFSNTWNVYSGFFSATFDPSTGTTSTPIDYPTFFTGNSAGGNSMYGGQRAITYAMSYIIQNSKVKVLANPRLIITNGQTATIDLSNDYVKTVTSQVSSTGTLTPVVTRTYTIGNDMGIKVSIVPFISRDGYVTLNIQPQYSTEKGKEYSPAAVAGQKDDLAATLLQRRNLDLKNIRIKDGETFVIGGLLQEKETKKVSKIPVLGDLPGVGMFFRNTENVKEKLELVIMLTPRIIKESEDIVNKPNLML